MRLSLLRVVTSLIRMSLHSARANRELARAAQHEGRFADAALLRGRVVAFLDAAILEAYAPSMTGRLVADRAHAAFVLWLSREIVTLRERLALPTNT